MFFKIGARKNLSNFTSKHVKTCNFVKKRLQHRCFPVKFAKFLRTPPMAASEFCFGGCVTMVSVSGTRAELPVLHTYVENQVSKCKQTKEQGSEDCLWTHIFTFL